MKSHTCRTKLWNIACYFIPALMSEINLTEGIRWITIPSQISKCTGQTANLTWEYVKEANEEIRQLQWRVNTTTLIAYSSERTGFYVDPKYRGRVEKIGGAGIMLKNISSKDIGNYTLYPVVSWQESQIMQSIWLNVIEVTIQQWCTCERLPISPEWSGGRTFSIVTDGCHLEINSSFCCPKGPAIECMDNDPQKLCVPITNHFNMTESTNQSRNPNNLIERTTQCRTVPEQTGRANSTIPKLSNGPTDVQKANTALDVVNMHLPVVNTAMLSVLVVLSFIFVCCLRHIWWGFVSS